MGPWPFDRLISALAPVCEKHDVFAQIGTSRVLPPCEYARFITPEELDSRIRAADVVITHAGNTVRLVQRAGKVPLVVARRSAPGEMPNDHQVDYLLHEQASGRVVPVWDLATLPDLVSRHSEIEQELIHSRPLADPADPADVADIIDGVLRELASNPFARHPLRRYAYAWKQLHAQTGRHLDVGCNDGRFVGELARSSRLECYGIDPHFGQLARLRRSFASVRVCRISPAGPWPFPDEAFDSLSALDVLEHVAREDVMLEESRRVLRKGGLLVLTVPAVHALSWMDPDNLKFRMPKLFRAQYVARFGAAAYFEEYVDRSNGLFGEMSLGKREHTHYDPEWLTARLGAHGFECVHQARANLFWRCFQVPALLLDGVWRQLFEAAMWADGELFHAANLFLTARRVS
jgi:SAM-dependent methyltransferase